MKLQLRPDEEALALVLAFTSISLQVHFAQTTNLFFDNNSIIVGIIISIDTALVSVTVTSLISIFINIIVSSTVSILASVIMASVELISSS